MDKPGIDGTEFSIELAEEMLGSTIRKSEKYYILNRLHSIIQLMKGQIEKDDSIVNLDDLKLYYELTLRLFNIEVKTEV